MNGQTNVQISALATFVSVALLWLASYFLPDLMATAPEMLGELFTGALIVSAGILFKSDAGIKALPGTGTDTNSPAFIGVIALILGALVLSGCSGTRAAYKAADGLAETSYVVGEHYFAEVRGINRLDDEGKLSPANLRSLQRIALETRPLVVSLIDAGSAYRAVRSAENEATLAAALSEAAVAISRLVDAIKAVGGSSQYNACMDAALMTESPRAITYCQTVAVS